MTSREETVTLLDALTQTLSAVNAALLSMKDGSYGSCAECGEPIARKRLEAIPWASHCIGCQETMDRRGNRQPAFSHWNEAA